MNAVLKNILVRDGYVFLDKYMLNKATSELVENLEAKEGMEPASKIHRLTPKTTTESTPNTYSGQYGYHEFPMHTDLAHWPRPPRYLLLRCIKGSSQVSTRLLDGNQIVNILGVRAVERALVKPRRLINGKMSLMRIFQSGAPSLFRWDETFIVPASPAGSAGISAVVGALKETNIANIVLENASDTLLIDNWRMLHGRSAVPDGGDDRIIERVYLGDKT